MKKKLKLAISFFALCQAMELVLFDLKGTSLYRHVIKNLCNRLYKEVEKEVDRINDLMNDESRKYFDQTTDMVNTMVDVIKEKDIDVFITLLKEFRDDKVCILPDDEHEKMIEQIREA